MTTSLLFANYMQLPTVLPKSVWRVLRQVCVVSALAVAALLVLQPQTGLPLFWGLIIPALPLVFMFMPGLWRNLCPLATSNQTPRKHKFMRAATHRTLPPGIAYPIGVLLLIMGVIGRRLLFNVSGLATAALIVGAMVAAFRRRVAVQGQERLVQQHLPVVAGAAAVWPDTVRDGSPTRNANPASAAPRTATTSTPARHTSPTSTTTTRPIATCAASSPRVFPGLVLGYYLVPPVAEIGSAVHRHADAGLHGRQSDAVHAGGPGGRQDTQPARPWRSARWRSRSSTGSPRRSSSQTLEPADRRDPSTSRSSVRFARR